MASPAGPPSKPVVSSAIHAGAERILVIIEEEKAKAAHEAKQFALALEKKLASLMTASALAHTESVSKFSEEEKKRLAAEKRVEELETEKRDLEARLEASENMKKEMERKLKQVEADKVVVLRRCDEMEAQQNDLRNRLSEKQKRMEDLEGRIEIFKIDVEILGTEALEGRALKEEVDEVREELRTFGILWELGGELGLDDCWSAAKEDDLSTPTIDANPLSIWSSSKMRFDAVEARLEVSENMKKETERKLKEVEAENVVALRRCDEMEAEQKNLRNRLSEGQNVMKDLDGKLEIVEADVKILGTRALEGRKLKEEVDEVRKKLKTFGILWEVGGTLGLGDGWNAAKEGDPSTPTLDANPLSIWSTSKTRFDADHRALLDLREKYVAIEKERDEMKKAIENGEAFKREMERLSKKVEQVEQVKQHSEGENAKQQAGLATLKETLNGDPETSPGLSSPEIVEQMCLTSPVRLVRDPSDAPEDRTGNYPDNPFGVQLAYSVPGTVNFRKILPRPFFSSHSNLASSPLPRLQFMSQSTLPPKFHADKVQQSVPSSSADPGPSQSSSPALGVDGKKSDAASSGGKKPLKEQSSLASSSKPEKDLLPTPGRVASGSNPQSVGSPASSKADNTKTPSKRPPPPSESTPPAKRSRLSAFQSLISSSVPRDDHPSSSTPGKNGKGKDKHTVWLIEDDEDLVGEGTKLVPSEVIEIDTTSEEEEMEKERPTPSPPTSKALGKKRKGKSKPDTATTKDSPLAKKAKSKETKDLPKHSAKPILKMSLGATLDSPGEPVNEESTPTSRPRPRLSSRLAKSRTMPNLRDGGTPKISKSFASQSARQSVGAAQSTTAITTTSTPRPRPIPAYKGASKVASGALGNSPNNGASSSSRVDN